MKVLHVIETLGLGGAERLLVTLLPELERQGAKCSVAVLKPPLDLKPALEAHGIEVLVLPRHNKWNLFAGARAVAGAGARFDADILHAHLYFPSIYVAIAKTLGFTRAKTFVTFHNLAFAAGTNKAGPGMLARAWLARVFFRYGMNQFLAVSRATAKNYQQALWLGKVSVLHNPVDLGEVDRIGAQSRSLQQGDANEPVILLPGRLVHEKGHLFFLDVLAALRQRRGLAFKAVFAGEGPLREAVEARIAELELGSVVDLAGVISYEEMISLMAGSDIIVTPSRFEGFGLTALEGMAAGKPVVATRVGGLPEVVGEDAGILVDYGDVEGMADELEALIRNRNLRERAGQAARKRVESEFQLPAIGAKLHTLYSGIVAGSGGEGEQA